MPVKITTLQPWRDQQGNSIQYSGDPIRAAGVEITFSGSNNTLCIAPDALFKRLRVEFKGSGSHVSIGRAWGPRPSQWVINVGHGCCVDIGNDVTTTSLVYIVAAEGSAVRVGNDCMFATAIELRATDSHAIYEIDSGERINHSQDVVVGDHCWLATAAVIMPGGSLGAGSVLGHRATLIGRTPENCVAVGVPARAVRHGIKWERPQTLDMPATLETSSIPLPRVENTDKNNNRS